MSPRLFIHLFGNRVHSFQFFGVVGFIAGCLLCVLLAKFLHLMPGVILILTAIAAITFFLLSILVKWINKKETIVYYHHEIAILVLCSIALHYLKLPLLPYLDVALLGIGAFLSIGRLGCLSVGCCHGRPHKYGIKYGKNHVEVGFTWYYEEVPLLPVQLIESVYVLSIVIAGILLLSNKSVPGTVLIFYTVIYGLMRFILEFLRGDPERPLWMGLSEAQWTTLMLIGITFVMSKFGWLPQYNWHSVILILLLLVVLAMILHIRFKTNYYIFCSTHIKQIAEVLNLLDNNLKISPNGNSDKVKVFATKAGLTLSSGQNSGDHSEIRHYTISLRKPKIIHKKTVEKMAILIGQLKKYTGDYNIIESRKGIFHIAFKINKGNLSKNLKSGIL